MSKIKNGGLDQYGAEPFEVSNSSNMEQLALNGLTFESLELETSVMVCRYTFRMFRSSLYIKVIGSRSRSQQHKACLCVLFSL